MRGHLLVFTVLVGLAAVLAAGAAGSGVKPAIGAPKASPAQPRAGAGFAVAFHVAHAKSVRFDVTLGGRLLHHRDSFRGGVARTAVVLPLSAGGKALKVTLDARLGQAVATKRASFVVRAAPPPSVSIDSASAPEGNSGTTPMSFQVSLTHAAATAVSVKYATSDGTATAPSDYVATSGTLTFSPGETTKAVVVMVVGDVQLEQDERFTVTLSDPVGATLGIDSATGTITNDDTAAPISAGSWQGATQEGNYVFFTVTPSRTITQFRSNSLTEDCGNGEYLQGSVSWGSQQWPIASDGSLAAQYSWTGSQQEGDITLTAETWKITGLFSTASTMNGSISLADQFTYQGTQYNCSGSVTFSANLQPG